MKRNVSDYLVALSVIGCSVVLLIALTVALTGYHLKKPSRTLAIDFTDVAGIHAHSEVRYAGAPAGRVLSVRPLTPAERSAPGEENYAVRASVSINDDIPPLPADIAASIGSDTLLSEKFVGLSAGTPNGQTLANNAHLFAQSAFSFDSVLASVGPILEDARGLIAKLRVDLGTLIPKVDGLVGSVDQVAGSAKTAAKGAEDLLARAEKLIADNEGDIHARLTELQGVLGDLDKVLHRANGFVDTTDKELNRRLEELGVALQNLKVITTHAKSITETLGEKPSRLIWGSKTKKLTPERDIIDSSKPLPANRQ